MSYHATVFENKDFRKYFSRDQLERLQLIHIKGRPAKKKNIVEWKGNFATVFGSNFVAKVALLERRVL